MKNRTELAKYFAELGFVKGAEVGVYMGYYSKVLLENIPNLNLLSIDPYHRMKVHATIYPKVAEDLKRYPGCTLLRGFSMDVVKIVSDESLDFVFIDGDHGYDSVINDIREWAKKVKKGGIVSGHDYLHMASGNVGVVQAVDEYVKEVGADLKVTDWDRYNRHSDDKQPSWYFFKT